MTRPTETELEFRAGELLRKLRQPPTVLREGQGLNFWTGYITDLSHLETDRTIECMIAGEKKPGIRCFWSSGEVSLGDWVGGIVDSLSQYWAFFILQRTSGSPALPHSHIFHEIPKGEVNGSNKDFETLYLFKEGTLHVYLNGLLQYPEFDYKVDAGCKKFSFLEAPLKGDSVEVAYLSKETVPEFSGGEYVLVVDGDSGKVARCQNVWAASITWEIISQNQELQAFDLAEITWMPPGTFFVCGGQGIWMTYEALEAEPSNIDWTQILSIGEIRSQIGEPTQQLWLWMMALDYQERIIYVGVAVRDRGIWVCHSHNNGGSWHWSNRITCAPPTNPEELVDMLGLTVGNAGTVYVTFQGDFIYRSSDRGHTFSEAAWGGEPGYEWNGCGLTIGPMDTMDSKLLCCKFDAKAPVAYNHSGTFSFFDSSGLAGWERGDVRSPRCLVFHPNSEDHLWVVLSKVGPGTSNEMEIYKSSDQGVSFKKLKRIKEDPIKGYGVCLTPFRYSYQGLYLGMTGTGVDSYWPVMFASRTGGLTWVDCTGNWYTDELGTTKARFWRVVPLTRKG